MFPPVTPLVPRPRPLLTLNRFKRPVISCPAGVRRGVGLGPRLLQHVLAGDDVLSALLGNRYLWAQGRGCQVGPGRAVLYPRATRRAMGGQGASGAWSTEWVVGTLPGPLSLGRRRVQEEAGLTFMVLGGGRRCQHGERARRAEDLPAPLVWGQERARQNGSGRPAGISSGFGALLGGGCWAGLGFMRTSASWGACSHLHHTSPAHTLLLQLSGRETRHPRRVHQGCWV